MNVNNNYGQNDSFVFLLLLNISQYFHFVLSKKQQYKTLLIFHLKGTGQVLVDITFPYFYSFKVFSIFSLLNYFLQNLTIQIKKIFIYRKKVFSAVQDKILQGNAEEQ